ncbi:MAG: DUF6609 family protein [Chloroflexota bacterium]|nr:DUF6609 family protein [Chloroflexota bacterium]
MNIIGILIIVGAHFLLFFPAQGWLVVVLALVCMACGWYALRNERISISAAYCGDGVIKVVSGLAMVLFYPA